MREATSDGEIPRVLTVPSVRVVESVRSPEMAVRMDSRKDWLSTTREDSEA